MKEDEDRIHNNIKHFIMVMGKTHPTQVARRGNRLVYLGGAELISSSRLEVKHRFNKHAVICYADLAWLKQGRQHTVLNTRQSAQAQLLHGEEHKITPAWEVEWSSRLQPCQFKCLWQISPLQQELCSDIAIFRLSSAASSALTSTSVTLHFPTFVSS